ncbi:hypothetical protein BUALT_Bualt08G0049600 [Buddleja alternifolia]|uniref:Uncharacterized protein n=1 Tax=Buddleja alternifolia TaxID=168488 RepID=A0AAV6XCA2_9LAMI|nr:hypothetical protein BUALT_Bualt08G0049600 [Buddleja alternifolia]
MEVLDEEDDIEGGQTEVEMAHVEQEVDESHATDFHVFVHAMSGMHDYRTMRVMGHVGSQNVHILIDTGSTHNFLDVNTARRLGSKIEETALFPVSVADGNKIFSSSTCKGFSWKMQGVQFIADMMLFPLGGCDMVLGVQWLVQLGDISWNFDKLTMKFIMAGKKVALRGKKPAIPKVIGKDKMRKVLQKPAQISMLQVGILTQTDAMQEVVPLGLHQNQSHPQLYSLDTKGNYKPLLLSTLKSWIGSRQVGSLILNFKGLSMIWSKILTLIHDMHGGLVS